jgi:hypothetical protein
VIKATAREHLRRTSNLVPSSLLRTCPRTQNYVGGRAKLGRLRVRRLVAKGLIDTTTGHDEHESYDALQMTDHGWRWIDANEDRFLLRKSKDEQRDFEAPPERW